MRRRSDRQLAVGLALLVGLVLARGALAGQVVVDNSFGHPGPLNGPNFTIGAGLGKRDGSNLFQSFSTFDLDKADIATFTAPAKVRNILVRVTGSSASSIDGTIASRLDTDPSTPHPANFYLIDPAGVVFGPHAVLDVGGSFAVTTADYVRMGDGTRFMASHAPKPALSTAPPAAFGFLNHHPGPITMNGDPNDDSANAFFSSGTLSIVGGNIAISQQTVFADNVRSVASPGEVPLMGVGHAPAGRDARQPRGGTISVTNESALEVNASLLTIDAGTVNVSGISTIASLTQSDSPGGDLLVHARSTLNINHGNIAAYSQAADIGDVATGASGNIRVIAPRINLDGIGDTNNAVSGIFTEADSEGPAGKVTVAGARLIYVTGAAVIGSNTFARGAGGDVYVRAKSVVLNGNNEGDGNFTGMNSNAVNGDSLSSTGAAGDVHLTVENLQILDGAGVVSNSLLPGAGKGGKVDVHAGNILIDGRGANVATSIDALSGSLLTATDGSGKLVPVAGGPGGSVKLDASNLTIRDGGSIRVNTSGPENAGRINVQASNILIDRAGSQLNTGIGAQVEAGVSGNGGSIHISARRVTAVRGGLISVETLGTGSAGSLSVDAKELTLTSGAMIQSNAAGSGNGGDLSVDVRSRLRILDAGAVTAASSEGIGGDIRIASGRSILLDHGSITTNAAQKGGSVHIAAPATVDLRNGSQITTNSGGANGGNITIDPISLTLLNGSGIHANGGVSGGKITLQADRQRGVVTKAAVPDVTATGTTGVSGSIVAVPDQLDIVGSLVLLQTRLATPTTLLPQCGLRLGQNQSSFIVTGRGGMPAEPGGWLPDLSFTPPSQAEPQSEPNTLNNAREK